MCETGAARPARRWPPRARSRSCGSSDRISSGRPDEQVGCLQGLNPTDEQQHDRVDRGARRGAGRSFDRRGEPFEIDARADHPDAFRDRRRTEPRAARPRRRCWRPTDRRRRPPGPRRCCASPAPGRRPRPGRSSSPWPSCASSAPAGRPTVPSPATPPALTASSGCARGRSSRGRAEPRHAARHWSRRRAGLGRSSLARPSYGPSGDMADENARGQLDTWSGGRCCVDAGEHLDLGARQPPAAAPPRRRTRSSRPHRRCRAGPAGTCGR